MIDFIKWLFWTFFPRFIEEDVAANFIDNEWAPLYPVSLAQEYDEYTHVVTLKSFNLFGFAILPRLVKSATREEYFK
jgi:hypothetical protein